MYYRVLTASQRYHGKESLTYNSDKTLKIGQIITVQLQNKSTYGVVDGTSTKPKFKTKNIVNSWDLLIPSKSLELLKWLQDYYPASLGVITQLFTPPNLPAKLPDIPIENDDFNITELPPLTAEQLVAVDTINHSKTSSVLLHGDTGTGKTRVYIELSKQALEEEKSVIVLTPEIGLTGALVDTFSKTFGNKVSVTHSGLTLKERRKIWISASRSQTGMIIIGPRSALFTPLKNIGLIVVDEAHDNAYKQEKSPNYQTTRVAAKFAEIHNAKFIMGSATPLISDYFAFKNKNLCIQRMTKLAIRNSAVSKTEIIDLRNKDNFSKSPWIADSLLSAIESAIKNKEQSLLFLNRRGSARLVLCTKCGWHAICPRCDVSLTFHHDSYDLRCHSCDYKETVPTNCPTCNSHDLQFKSIGTKSLEREITKIFPKAKISRFDGDTPNIDNLNQKREELQSGKIDILIGTQSIAKGFDLPRLSVVGIIQADSSLLIPDYTASELTFQLISQVSGRINRGHRAGSLFVQTYTPDSDLIKMSLEKDYINFYNKELKQRKTYNFPPYVYLLKINCSRATSQSALSALMLLSDQLRTQLNGTTIEGPSPRFIEKVSGKHSWHLIIKSTSRKKLLEVIKLLPNKYTYDLDPNNLL